MSQLPSKWTATDDDRLRNLARSGFSLAEISAQMRWSKSTIRSRALKLNIALARDLNGAQKTKRTLRFTKAE